MSTQKNKKLSGTGSDQVELFLQKLEHPLKQEILGVRQIILNAHPALTEHIKWNAPSYCIQGEDRITFNLHGKDFFRLIFHRGAKTKAPMGQQKLLDETYELLDWADMDRAVVKLTDWEDIQTKEENLRKTIQAWIKVTS